MFFFSPRRQSNTKNCRIEVRKLAKDGEVFFAVAMQN